MAGLVVARVADCWPCSWPGPWPRRWRGRIWRTWTTSTSRSAGWAWRWATCSRPVSSARRATACGWTWAISVRASGWCRGWATGARRSRPRRSPSSRIAWRRWCRERSAGCLPWWDLGVIEWTDYQVGLDAHVVWALPANLLTYAGLGVSAHVLNGSGEAIEGTFIEDLLDSVSAGFNLHLGGEYPVTDRFRLHGEGRYEVLEDMQYFQIRLGGSVLWGSLVPGEERR